MEFKINKKVIIVFILVFAIVLGGATYLRVSIYNKLDDPIFTPDDDVVLKFNSIVSGEGSPYYDAFTDGKRINFLILGVATTVANKPLTDSIMLASYDRVNYTVDIISIPRDSYYNRDQYSIWSGLQKINSIYETEGILGIASAVSNILSNIPIHYYLTVEYDDIKTLVDVIDGVDVEVPFHLKYDDPYDNPPLHIDIPAGLQHIDSTNVIQLLRFRKTNSEYAEQGYRGYNDTGRMEMQQKFLKACIKKVLSKPSYISNLIKKAMECIGSDIDYELALTLSSDITKLDLSNVNTHTVPTTMKGTSETGGVSFLFINYDELVPILDGIFLTNENETAQ